LFSPSKDDLHTSPMKQTKLMHHVVEDQPKGIRGFEEGRYNMITIKNWINIIKFSVELSRSKCISLKKRIMNKGHMS
jgi:hypothetical protein